MKARENIKIFAAVFIAVEIALYAAYMCLDIFTDIDTAAIKYISVVLCFLVSVIFLRKEYLFPNALLCAALMFSVIADIFLLLIGKYFIAGLLLFTAAQCAYAFYIFITNAQKAWISLSARALAVAAAALLATRFAQGESVIILSAAYGVLSLCNIIQSLTKRKTHLLAVGLILLLLCDIGVGIVNLNNLSPSLWTQKLVPFVRYTIWFFYLPSQVCITFINLRCANESSK